MKIKIDKQFTKDLSKINDGKIRRKIKELLLSEPL